MRHDIATALSNVAVAPAAVATPLTLNSGEELYPESLSILRLLGQALATRSTEQIASHFQSSSQKTQLFVDQLVNLGLVRRDLNALTGASYALNEKGRHLLHEQGLL